MGTIIDLQPYLSIIDLQPSTIPSNRFNKLVKNFRSVFPQKLVGKFLNNCKSLLFGVRCYFQRKSWVKTINFFLYETVETFYGFGVSTFSQV